MAKGNPSPNTAGLAPPFKPGQSGNPGGKTAEQRRLEVEAAEMAAKLRHMMLTELLEASQAGALGHLSGDVLKLAKDSEDRAFGSPKQSVEHGSDPENPMPMVIPVRWHDPE